MTDPLGLLGSSGALIGPGAPFAPRIPAGQAGVDFKQTLQEQINRVNELQSDANAAIEDLATGRRDDVESVILATQKADIAFRMLLQVRNKVMDAFEEVKQLRI